MSSITPSASLITLLRCFNREDVTSLQLVSGEVATATRATGTVPLTQVALTVSQVETLMQGTPVADALAKAPGAQDILEFAIAERRLRIAVSRREGQVHIRIARNTSPERPAPIVSVDAALKELDPVRPRPMGHPGITLSAAPVPALTAKHEAMARPAPAENAGATSALKDAPTPHGANPSKAALDVALPAPAPKVRPEAAASVPAPKAIHVAPAGVDAHAVAQLDVWVQKARDAQASDLHLIPDEPPRMRCGGELTVLSSEPFAAATLHAMGLGLLDSGQRALLQARGYVDLAVALVAAGRVRANIARHPKGVKICLRLIAEEVPTLDALRLPADLAAVTQYHQGLAVVSGPSGHGKTATLAALINLINQQSAHHIILIEDPIEVVHPVHKALISQRQVGRDTRSYARALKAALREDPDVIVVGELRDRETVEIALSAAETGHLVLATMNTRSAGKTIDRLIDLFPPEDQAQVRNTLAGSLRMVISQRLLPCVQGGLVPAVELLTGSVPLWALIRDNKLFQLPSLQQRGRSAGMIRLDSSLLDLVRAGHVKADVARRYAENGPEFERQLQAAGLLTPSGQ